MNSVNKTLYVPLCGKSYVSKKGLFLEDKKAEEIWEAEGIELKGKSKSKWLAYYMGVRSAVFDEWVKRQMVAMLDAGELPLRVTHNDTKLNNVMFRASDRTPLCVVDLDTTMPGLSAYDFGDAIRFGASTAAEDEKDLSKVWMDLELFRLFTKGYLEACPGLTEKEKEVLPLAAFTMTLECGIRFLADYIDGDNYFSIHYPEQNLDRCHTQFKLVADMEAKWDEMVKIVAKSGNQ